MTDTKNPVSDELPSLLEQWALDIDRDGTPSQAGPSVEELRQLAQSLRASIPGGVGVKRWFLGAQNDGLFIIDTPPRPSNDDQWHDRPDGPELVIALSSMDRVKAQAIVDAHNSALDLSPAEGEPVAAEAFPVALVDFIWQELCEEDRSSPEDQPDMALVCRNDLLVYAEKWNERLSHRAAPSSPVVSDEMVERMAEWMALDHVSVSDRAEYSWDATDAVWKDAWRKKAQTALEAALSVKPQSEGGKP